MTLLTAQTRATSQEAAAARIKPATLQETQRTAVIPQTAATLLTKAATSLLTAAILLTAVSNPVPV